ncbi:MAG: tRNA (5-methylaminomethyl-2-thiouridine)(34)-methyltransferase MnmD [Bacteroidota bacterium]
MELVVTRTADGSDTVFRPDLNQHYHSTFGAVQETRQIFIENGFLHSISKKQPGNRSSSEILHILEIGFGTGLNALMTLIEAEKRKINLHYTSVEPYPLDETCWMVLNYPDLPGSADYSRQFSELHQAAWNRPVNLTPKFILHKVREKIEHFQPDFGTFDLVYFDAFGPDAQPELWTEEIFRNVGMGMAPGAVLVTYSVKGTVVRALRAAGFTTEKLPGPPGKRHILRATKI